MFADLVGSTALSVGMDPEDLRDVFRPIRVASTKPSAGSVGSSHNTWATA